MIVTAQGASPRLLPFILNSVASRDTNIWVSFLNFRADTKYVALCKFFEWDLGSLGGSHLRDKGPSLICLAKHLHTTGYVEQAIVETTILLVYGSDTYSQGALV